MTSSSFDVIRSCACTSSFWNWSAARGATAHVYWSLVIPAIHLSHDLFSCYEIGITCSEIVFDRSDLFPTFTGEIRMFDCITGCVTEELAPRVEPLFLPLCIDIVE